jgi:hypothetical protein
MQLIRRPNGRRMQTGYVKNDKFVPHGGERDGDSVHAIYRNGVKIIEMDIYYHHGPDSIRTWIKPDKMIVSKFRVDGTLSSVSERTKGRACIPVKELRKGFGKTGKKVSETEYVSGKLVKKTTFSKKGRTLSVYHKVRGRMIRELADQEEARILAKSW